MRCSFGSTLEIQKLIVGWNWWARGIHRAGASLFIARAIIIARAAEAATPAGSGEIRRPEAEVEAAGGGGEVERTEAEAATVGGGRSRSRSLRRPKAVGGGRWSAAEAWEQRRVACAMQSRPPACALNRRPLLFWHSSMQAIKQCAYLGRLDYFTYNLSALHTALQRDR